jgi:cleavage and polyadenylation specificity factor subunit 1
VIAGARGIWSVPVRQSVKTNGVSYEKVAKPNEVDIDTVIISTDATPSPGLSRVSNGGDLQPDFAELLQLQFATKTTKGDVSITNRVPGTTIGAGPFFQRTAILHVMNNAIRVLEPGRITSFRFAKH